MTYDNGLPLEIPADSYTVKISGLEMMKRLYAGWRVVYRTRKGKRAGFIWQDYGKRAFLVQRNKENPDKVTARNLLFAFDAMRHVYYIVER